MLCKFLQSCDYENGYLHALSDVKNWFERHSISLKTSRMYNQKNIEMLLNTISKNAVIFQKYGEDTEMYFKHEKNKVIEITMTKS